MKSEKRFDLKAHGDFWSQAPVVLFAAAAVLAILFVNVRSQAAGIRATPESAAPKPSVQRSCPGCGVVVALDSSSSLHAEGTVAVAVRLGDGTVRTMIQPAPGLQVGRRVRVSGDALVADD